MTMMTSDELIQAASAITGGKIEGLSVTGLRRLMTVTQYVTDLCLNEVENRGALTYDRETLRVIIPYQSDYMVETVLTRGCGQHQPGRIEHIEGAWRSLV
jgi:hypothetical protein